MAKKIIGKKQATSRKRRKGISQMDAMRQAMSELGDTASSAAIQSFLKERFGLEMSRQYISKYKSKVREYDKKKGKPVAAKPAATPTVTKAATAPKPKAKTAPASEGKTDGISLQDIETVKGLVGRVGVNSLTRLIDLLAR